MNIQGRPTRPKRPPRRRAQTFTGNRGLDMEEALIFEIGRARCDRRRYRRAGDVHSRGSAPHARQSAIGLPGLTEPEAIRHYVRLSRKNYAIDAGLYPLGSCTMKHNPRLNEKMARLPGFADIHPLQPHLDRAGRARADRRRSRNGLLTLTGMSAVAMSPKAGAHGELCGMMAIKAAIEARGEGATRRVVLVPDSAHGTNPATAALIGYRRASPCRRGADGTVDRRSGAARARARRRRDHADQSEHLRAVRARDRRDRRGGARGRRLFLLRRRQLQRHRRQGAAGRSRRRRHAHQPAQDLLDPAWRRRPGRGAGRAVAAARAFAPVPFVVRDGGRACGWSSTREGDASRSAACAPSTARWACSCARWPTCCRTARTGCGRPRRTRCCTPITCAPASPI